MTFKQFYVVILLFVACVFIASCAPNPKPLPTPPSNLEIVEKQVPVPVLCKATIDKTPIAIDTAKTGQRLENQNATMRASIAQQQAYIKKLEGGIIGCGGEIK